VSSTVYIQNHLPGGHAYCGKVHAIRMVKQGRAQWVGGHAIRINEKDHRHIAAAKCLYDKIATAINYDKARLTRRIMFKNIPLAGPNW
jgi:hypothetical protein